MIKRAEDGVPITEERLDVQKRTSVQFRFLAGELTIDTRDELWPKAPHTLWKRLKEIEAIK